MIFSILVVYNTNLDEVTLAIDSLKSQTDLVVICNNSDNGFVIPETEKTKVFNFNENLGIAEAQSIGMSWAFTNGAEFIVQMDQDSLLPPNTISLLLERYNQLTALGFNIGVIGPRHYDKVTNEVDEGRIIKGKAIENTNSEIIHATISSASLIPKKAFDTVGRMDDGLFIDSVDWEYCWRLKNSGFITIRCNDLLLGHRVGNGVKKIFGPVNVRVPSPIRHYYHTRNLFLLSSRSYVPFYWKFSNYLKLLFKITVYPFAFDDGMLRLKFILKGIYDGLLGRVGRIDIASRKSR
ncbi:glycosyltransferase family 2 protein [Shewanella sp. A32]|uniref:glycosyltransferase family 2 protein n=1 Tax=Shewanella sp. A32 TaxID=3031327 RepID=UPI0023B96F4C|nr:glycosyltransferase family 2 protein [Shewanella sp. A32]MDF0533020.1 glycosyltransferase family 2 protein [Shewanella sp. A32]